MSRSARSFLLLTLAYLGFVSLGLPDGLLGVAWPSIRASFALPLDALGPLLVMSTTCYVLSSACSGWILGRINLGALLALSCVATAASLFGYAAAPRWWVMVSFASLAGWGAGAIDAGINTYVATHHSTRTLNWLHACYGLGAAAGPAIMTTVLMSGWVWRWGYAGVGSAQLLLAACFAATIFMWPRAGTAANPSSTPIRPTAAAATLRVPAVWLSIAAFFIYTGLEASAGAWTYSMLTEARGMDPAAAGRWVSAYWAALMAGRVIFGLLAGVAPIDQLLRACMIGLGVAASLITFGMTPLVTCAGLALLGLAAGPVFPSLIAATPARIGEAHTANAVGLQIAAAALGQSLFPAVVGILARRAGLDILGPVTLAAAVALLLTYEALSMVSPAAGSLRLEAESAPAL